MTWGTEDESICEELRDCTRIWMGSVATPMRPTIIVGISGGICNTPPRVRVSPQRDQTCVQTGPWSQLVCRGAEALGCYVWNASSCQDMPSEALFSTSGCRRAQSPIWGEWYSLPFLISGRVPFVTTIWGTFYSLQVVFCANVYRCTIFNNFVFWTRIFPNECSLLCVVLGRTGAESRFQAMLYVWKYQSTPIQICLCLSLGFSDPVGIVWIRARTLPAWVVRYHPETVQKCRHQTI
jgi:hypothetical protein